MHQRAFRPNYIFNNYVYFFFDFPRRKLPFDFLNLNPFQHPQVLHFGVLNYKTNKQKKHKEGVCKVLEDLSYFQHFMQIFVLVPNQ